MLVRLPLLLISLVLITALQAQNINAEHHGTTGLQLARQGDFEQAATYWEPVLDYPDKLHGYGFGRWFTQALEGDSLAVAFFQQETGSQRWQQHMEPLRLFFNFRSAPISQTEQLKLTENLLNKGIADCFWQPFYQALLVFDYARRFPNDSAAILRLYEHQIGQINRCLGENTTNQGRLQFLKAVYNQHLAALGKTVPEISTFQISSADYHSLNAFLLQPGFRNFEGLISAYDALIPKQLIDFQFSQPQNKQLLESLKSMHRNGAIDSRRYVAELTADWPEWTSGQLFPDLPATNKGWLLIDFWATWCHPCREELPGLQQLYDSIQSLTAPQLEIRTYLSKSPNWRKFMDAQPYSFHAQHLDETIFQAIQINSFPTTLLIAPNGKYQRIDPLGDRLPWLLWLAQRE